MTCVLHFLGDEADVDELRRLSPIEPCALFRKGQPSSNRPNARLSQTSGLSLIVSEASFDEIEQQQGEALSFLRANQAKLEAMRMVSGVEVASIDFGIAMRNVVVQSDWFEPDLLLAIASLQARLVLSQYPPAGRAKRIKQYRRALRRAA